MPDPSGSLPPWLLPHMHAPFRFVDGLAEDMLGYIFPAGNAVGNPVGDRPQHGARSEQIVRGRYVLPSGLRSRDPLGGPEIKCTSDQTFHHAGHAVAVQLAGGRVVHPALWMSLSGLPQRVPDRDTRGYFDARGRRVWLDVFR